MEITCIIYQCLSVCDTVCCTTCGQNVFKGFIYKCFVNKLKIRLTVDIVFWKFSLSKFHFEYLTHLQKQTHFAWLVIKNKQLEEDKDWIWWQKVLFFYSWNTIHMQLQNEKLCPKSLPRLLLPMPIMYTQQWAPFHGLSLLEPMNISGKLITVCNNKM